MGNHGSTSTVDGSARRPVVSWESIERYTSHAFLTAGGSLLASLFLPLGLRTVSERSWLVGIVLVGVAVVSVGVALLGLYPVGRTRSPRLAVVGAASAIVAGAAGLAVLGLSVVTVAAAVLSGVEFSVGRAAFAILALTMAGGYAVGLLSFGLVGLGTGDLPGRSVPFLTVGGLLMLVPVLGGLAQLGFGVSLPAWVLFPVLGLVAIDTVAVGITLRSWG